MADDIAKPRADDPVPMMDDLGRWEVWHRGEMVAEGFDGAADAERWIDANFEPPAPDAP